ncbi:hypothetical protein WICPIJ_002937 [Wickerhamomyces pijperi]|uniref:Uncharacterized protein n=1 Tax=Wickerhamomyces pijperi TaxID=599730 RepID=A0A9P8QAK0_WICPI|nr:hypothetical protein WICPIJ_002937 [Wickerhamomyces pijperi]
MLRCSTAEHLKKMSPMKLCDLLWFGSFMKLCVSDRCSSRINLLEILALSSDDTSSSSFLEGKESKMQHSRAPISRFGKFNRLMSVNTSSRSWQNLVLSSMLLIGDSLRNLSKIS